MADLVSHPQHYQLWDGSETLEHIRALSGSHDEFMAYLKGNAIKYLSRYQDKGTADQDLAKAQQYIQFMRDEMKRVELEQQGPMALIDKHREELDNHKYGYGR